jgi:hypothetical protein
MHGCLISYGPNRVDQYRLRRSHPQGREARRPAGASFAVLRLMTSSYLVGAEEGSMENLAGASRERPSIKVLAQQALLLLATCFASPAAADDSASYFLEPCRAATTDNAPLSGTTFLQGVCMGQVVGILHCICIARQA